jgi:DNA-binding PadR family transcriptional regulator
MNISTLEQKVLMAALALDPNGYGISIQNHISRLTKSNPPTGSVYAAINRLKYKKYIRIRICPPTPERGGRRKFCVIVTATGKASLQKSILDISLLNKEI